MSSNNVQPLTVDVAIGITAIIGKLVALDTISPAPRSKLHRLVETTMNSTSINEAKPLGELALQTLAMPRDTNANGDIFGGWLVSQMDLAAGIASKKAARGRSVTVAIKNVNFLSPVKVGSTVSCYAEVMSTGRTSVQINVEVWTSIFNIEDSPQKVADGLFVFVAIDDDGKPRPISK